MTDQEKIEIMRRALEDFASWVLNGVEDDQRAIHRHAQRTLDATQPLTSIERNY